MKKFSKALSLFLSLALLLTVFSTTAIAGDLSSEEISGDLVGVDHGVYQDNLTWTVEGDTLYIGGEGDMKTYDLFGTPWKNLHQYDIKHAIVSEGVTSISTYAFYQMSVLETISIAESVKSIGAFAFYSCSSLKSIKLPSSITEIPYEMFFFCTALENVEMSNSVTSIGERAFYFCEKLESITIPSSVTNIADNAFEDCAAFSTIKGEAGSYAEEYAKNKGLTFIPFTSEEAAIRNGAVDLGAEFYANINIPALDKTFTNNGAGNVVADTANGSDAQVWRFLRTTNKNTYVIESKLDGKYLIVDDINASLANVSATYTSMQYNIYSINGKYVIAPESVEDKVVDVNGVDFNVQYWTFNADNACQQYDIVKIGENDDTSEDETSEDVTSEETSEETSDDTTSDDTTSDDVISEETSDDMTSDEVIAIEGDPVDLGDEFYANINIPALDKTFTNNGAGNIVAEAANGSDAQVWHFIKVTEDNAYAIASELDGRYITIADINDSLANVYVSNIPQQYKVYSVNDKYVIAPAHIYNKVVDVNGVDFNVQYWTFNADNACQQYDIVKIGDDTTSDDVTSDDVTSDDVTSEETSDETSEETSDETSEETSDDVTSEETSDDVTSEETSDDVTSEETSDDTTSEETSDDTTSEETSDDVTSDDTTSDETSDDFVNPEDEYYMDDDTSTMPNVVENTLASDMISALEQNNVTVTITDKNGNVLGSDAKVGTGATVKTSDGKEFTVIVKGDVDGTGVVNATDYLSVKKAFSKDIELSGAFHSAADTDGNKTINATDYIKIKSYFLGDANLYA